MSDCPNVRGNLPATRDDVQAALDEMVAAGLIQVVPVCRVSVPDAWRELLPLDWRPWDGDDRSLTIFRNTKAGLSAATRRKLSNVL